MGDHATTETMQEIECYEFLGNDTLTLDEDSNSWISNNIDYFVSQSRGNEGVEEVNLYLYSFGDHDDGFWDKLGQAVGNLQALVRLSYFTPDYDYHPDDDEEDDEEEVVSTPIPDSEVVARILSYVRQKITLEVASHCVV